MRKMTWSSTLVMFSVLAGASAVGQQTPPRSKPPEPVWIWSNQCSTHQQLGLTVRFNRQLLYQGVIPVCLGSRDTEDGRVRFHFSGGHTFQGKYRTRPTDSIEADIWQAGGEPTALILGISFSSSNQVLLLNTVHIARPKKRASSQLDNGLIITTNPVHSR